MKTKKFESARTKARRESRKQTRLTHSPNFAKTMKSSNSDFIVWAVDRKHGHTLMIPTTIERLKELRTSLKPEFSQEEMNSFLNNTIRKPEVRVAISKHLYEFNEEHNQTQVETNDYDSPMGEFSAALLGWVAYTANEAIENRNLATMSFDFDSSNNATLYGIGNCDNLVEGEKYGWFMLASVMLAVSASKRKTHMKELSPQVQESLNVIMNYIRKNS